MNQLELPMLWGRQETGNRTQQNMQKFDVLAQSWTVAVQQPRLSS